MTSVSVMQEVYSILHKCPQFSGLSVVHVSARVLSLRAQGFPNRECIRCLAMAPLMFCWDMECARCPPHTSNLPEEPVLACFPRSLCWHAAVKQVCSPLARSMQLRIPGRRQAF
jgi:hypothetical protein